MIIRCGIDILTEKTDAARYGRIGFVTNNAAVTRNCELSRIALLKAGFDIRVLFSPEHGISAQGVDGESQSHGSDNYTGLPVISLYGEKMAPAREDLDGLDCILFDIPEVGCRFYTYQWTLYHVMRSCSEAGVRLVVADRPNILGGDFRFNEGPMLQAENISFCGLKSIPVRHGCSIGELAKYWAAQDFSDKLTLEIIKVEGWSRDQYGPNALNGFFVPTSPGIPDYLTALIYPGMGLLEGVNLNEGRGTTLPFKVCGAPWINSIVLVEKLRLICDRLGVKIIPYSYVPTWGRYAGNQCHGIMILDVDHDKFRPVRWGFELISTVKNLYPNQVKPEVYPTVANPTGERHLELLTGNSAVWDWLKNLDSELAEPHLGRSMDVRDWELNIQPFLLYR